MAAAYETAAFDPCGHLNAPYLRRQGTSVFQKLPIAHVFFTAQPHLPVGDSPLLCNDLRELTDLTMKPLRLMAQAIFVSATLLISQGQTINTFPTTILGEWDFNSPALVTATVGSNLVFQSNAGTAAFTPGFVTTDIAGFSSGVMVLPALNSEQRVLATFSPTNNGGGTNLNQYTLLIDLMWPPESSDQWRAIFNTETNNSAFLNDSEMFVNPDNRVGFNTFAGLLEPNTWHRLVMTIDLMQANQLTRYIDGTNATGTTSGSPLPVVDGRVDGRFSLNRDLLFFSDNDGEAAPVHVNFIQLRAGIMTPEEILSLGGPGAPPSVTVEPVEPGDFVIESITRDGNNLIIRVNTTRNVQLQTTTNLAPPNWTNVGLPTPGPTVTVPNTGTYGFFRVQRL